MKPVVFALLVFALTIEAAAAPLFAPLTAGKEKDMKTHFTRVSYKELTSRQQENHNFHKVAAALANYGFNSMRITDDWKGADFIAVHIDGETMLRIQLKSVLSIAKKYLGKNLHIAFPDGDNAYVFPHDEFVEEAEKQEKMTHTDSWKKEDGWYQISPTPQWAVKWLAPYRLTSRTPKE